MRNTLLFTLTFVLVSIFSSDIHAQSKEADNGYNIKFKIKGATDTIQLAYYYGDKKLLKDKQPANEKGEFEFSGSESLECGIYLVVIPNKGYFEFVANGQQHFTMESDTINLIENMKVKGNEENALFYDYLRFINPKGVEMNELSSKLKALEDTATAEGRKIRKDLIALDKEVNEYKKKFRETHKGTFIANLFQAMEETPTPEMKEIEDPKERQQARFNFYKAHFFDNLKLNDGCMVRTPILHGRVKKYMEDLTVQIPDSVIKEADYLVKSAGDSYEMFKYLVMTITRNAEKNKIMCFDKVRLHMYQEYYMKDNRVDWIDSTIEAKIKEEIAKLRYNQCNDTAQELVMQDTTGKSWRLSDIPADYTIVYFWSATCGHCKKATPKLQTLYEVTKHRYNWEVYSVCIDRDLKEFKKFINKYNFNWPNVYDTEDKNYFRVKYNVFSTPQIYILDKNKKIVAKRIDVSTIEKILSEKSEIEMYPEDKNVSEIKVERETKSNLPVITLEEMEALWQKYLDTFRKEKTEDDGHDDHEGH